MSNEERLFAIVYATGDLAAAVRRLLEEASVDTTEDVSHGCDVLRANLAEADLEVWICRTKSPGEYYVMVGPLTSNRPGCLWSAGQRRESKAHNEAVFSLAQVLHDAMSTLAEVSGWVWDNDPWDVDLSARPPPPTGSSRQAQEGA